MKCVITVNRSTSSVILSRTTTYSSVVHTTNFDEFCAFDSHSLFRQTPDQLDQFAN